MRERGSGSSRACEHACGSPAAPPHICALPLPLSRAPCSGAPTTLRAPSWIPLTGAAATSARGLAACLPGCGSEGPPLLVICCCFLLACHSPAACLSLPPSPAPPQAARHPAEGPHHRGAARPPLHRVPHQRAARGPARHVQGRGRQGGAPQVHRHQRGWVGRTAWAGVLGPALASSSTRSGAALVSPVLHLLPPPFLLQSSCCPCLSMTSSSSSACEHLPLRSAVERTHELHE